MLFGGFFAALREEGLGVTPTEWLTLHQALVTPGLVQDLKSFYAIARTIVVKDEADYDKYDRAFARAFRDAEPPAELVERLLEAMSKAGPRDFSPEQMAELERLPLEQVLENFRTQLANEQYHEHEGGNRAIGRRGTSTQGADGYNPAGVRIGQDGGRHRSAVQIAEFRRFRDYDPSRTLDVRGMRVALSRLRRLLREGPPEELDLDATIDETARNGGEIELVLQPRKRNRRKVLLLTDVGGSMSGYANLVSRFFSAANTEIKELEHYYFHNCVYDHLYVAASRREAISTHRVIERFRGSHLLVMVGDAAMAPTELTHIGGAIDLWLHNDRTGLSWLQALRTAFPDSVWLNPEPLRLWNVYYTIGMIRKVFPMFPLTQDGIVDAVRVLLGQKKAA